VDSKSLVEEPAAARLEDVADEQAVSRQQPDYFRWALVVVLRGGVLFAGALLLVGTVLYLLGAGGLPLGPVAAGDGELGGLASIRAPGNPLVLISYGLFVLVLLPIARVVLSLLHFIRSGDRLYVFLTSAVLAVLLIGIVWGKAL
jgi:uncharacterized membrane protein